VVKQQHQLFVALLVLCDAIVVTLAAYAAWVVRRVTIELQLDPGWLWPRQWEHWIKEPQVLLIVPIALFCIRMFGLYRPRRDRSLLSEMVQIGKASLATMAILLPALYIFEPQLFTYSHRHVQVLGWTLDAGRIQLGSLLVFLFALLGAHRFTFRVTLRALRRRGWNQRHVAVIGVGRLGQIVARTLERNSWTGIKVAYFIGHQDHTRRERCLDRPVLGGLADLERILEQNKPDAVYVALPVARSNLLPEVLGRLERFAVDVRVVPDLSPRYLPQSMTVSELDGMPILSYRECPTHGLGGVSKRALDIVGALVGLVIFAPVMLVVALLVRLSGPGPVIFKQRRVSLGGEVFKIYKFRTMRHVEDEASARAMALATTNGWTERNDPRITPIGRWLRRTSLDELPQLLNVLKGDMSLVGPRPERPELIARFREDWRGYMLRQHVKAGITGWAQVNGLRGQTSLKKRLQYDLFYVRHWSLGFDLRILLLTMFRGFVHKNAH
jgi:Undecaprenyl-phosphate glucose phosphotransferase